MKLNKTQLRKLIRKIIKEQVAPVHPGPFVPSGQTPGTGGPTPTGGPNVTTHPGPLSPAAAGSPGSGATKPSTSPANAVKQALSSITRNKSFIQQLNSMSEEEIMRKAQPIPRDVQALANRPGRVPPGVNKSWALLIFMVLFILRETGQI